MSWAEWEGSEGRGEVVPRGMDPMGGQLTGPAEIQDLLVEAKESLGRKLSKRTREEYAKAFRHFQGWLESRQIRVAFPIPVALVVAYVQSHRRALEKKEVSLSTVRMRLAAVANEQRRVGGPPVTSDPVVRDLLTVLRREVGRAEVQKEPLRTDQLDALGKLWEGPGRLTNRQSQARAIILLGFALAVRRVNLVGLNLSDLTFQPKGVVAFIVRSKTDQEAKGSELGAEAVGGPLCPVAALRDWLSRLDLDADGPVFRTVGTHDHIQDRRLSDRAVARIVKRAAAAVGCDEEQFAGHSLRSGYATAAAALGWDASRIAQQTQHRDLNSLRRYIHRANLFEHNAGGTLLRR